MWPFNKRSDRSDRFVLSVVNKPEHWTDEDCVLLHDFLHTHIGAKLLRTLEYEIYNELSSGRDVNLNRVEGLGFAVSMIRGYAETDSDRTDPTDQTDTRPQAEFNVINTVGGYHAR